MFIRNDWYIAAWGSELSSGPDAKPLGRKILDYPYHDDVKNWPHKHDMYPIKCNYKLLIDNLMDLTHLGFVHKKTIGGNAKVHVDAKMETTRKENGLHYIRWMLESTPPPT